MLTPKPFVVTSNTDRDNDWECGAVREEGRLRGGGNDFVQGKGRRALQARVRSDHQLQDSRRRRGEISPAPCADACTASSFPATASSPSLCSSFSPRMQALKSKYPEGVDLVIEHVGGKMLQTAINNCKKGGKVIIVGYISQCMCRCSLLPADAVLIGMRVLQYPHNPESERDGTMLDLSKLMWK
eukprot:1511468-Rhodomonas_salina.1